MKQNWATEDRLSRAQHHYESCFLCEHRCGVNRSAGMRGPCKAGAQARVYRHRVEYGEESELVPAHLFYLSGCDLRCVFCIQEVDAFDPRRGQPLTPQFFNEAVVWGKVQGARTLEWLGGEPTIHLPAILHAMAGCSDLPPIVWKSDFHFTTESLALLDGVVDIYLPDLKFGNDSCAKRLAGIDRYLPIITRNLMLAASQGDMIVRHLLLPGHFDCCYRPIVNWMREHLPEVKFSVRDGYLPRWQASHYAELGQPLLRGEGERARELALKAGLNVVY
jgi:putative pyruvate formate lyase activating enzyme